MSFPVLVLGMSILSYISITFVMILCALLCAIVKKYPLPKIIAIGLLLIFLPLITIEMWGSEFGIDEGIASMVANSTSIPYLIDIICAFFIVICIGCIACTALLLGIKNKLDRRLIYGWSLIAGLFNILWTGGLFYISQTYMEIGDSFNSAIVRCREKFLGLKLEDLIDRVFCINLFFLLALLAITIFIPVYRKFKKTENP